MKNKILRILTMALAVCLALCLFTACGGGGSNGDSGGGGGDVNTPTENLRYRLINNDTAYEVTGCKDENIEKLVIPETYEGKNVVKVYDKAFLNYRKLKSAVIPSTVKNIGKQAFEGCTALTKDELPDSMTVIDNKAFYRCEKLVDVKIPSSLTTLGEYSFAYSSIKNAVVPKNVINVEKVFASCGALESISVAEGNTKYKAVDGNLYSKDGKIFFQYACGKDDKSYSILSGVKTIYRCAFENCKAIETVNIPNTVTLIHSSAFSDCLSLKNITIPSSVTDIGTYAFHTCPSLETLEIPSSVSWIQMGTFGYCSSLKTLIIPKSVTRIGAFAFSSCTSLETITYNGTVYEWNSVTKDASWNYDFQSSVQCTNGKVTI